MTKKSLHPGAKWLFRLSAYLMVIPLIILLFVFLGNLIFILHSIFMLIFLGLLFIITIWVILAEVYVHWAYKLFLYEFTNTELKIERGVIWKKYSNIPYERVQNVDVTRGIIARIFGFSSVNIQTAGYSGFAYRRRGFGMHSEGSLPAVSIKEAEEIRKFVIKKISGKKSGL